MSNADRPLGAPVPGWTPPPVPPRAPMTGHYTRLEPLSDGHLPGLFTAFCEDAQGAVWDYMPVGPFPTRPDFEAFAKGAIASDDPMFFTIFGEDGLPRGFATFLRINPDAGSIEVGFISFSPSLQRTRAATEAIVLMARTAFDLGYRRFEWKCNALNAASRRAASRYGFSYEGVFRQMMVTKGRNRDTAWFAMIDKEYAALNDAWTSWLDPANFDAEGRQRRRLAELTGPLLAATDPAQ